MCISQNLNHSSKIATCNISFLKRESPTLNRESISKTCCIYFWRKWSQLDYVKLSFSHIETKWQQIQDEKHTAAPQIPVLKSASLMLYEMFYCVKTIAVELHPAALNRVSAERKTSSRLIPATWQWLLQQTQTLLLIHMAALYTYCSFLLRNAAYSCSWLIWLSVPSSVSEKKICRKTEPDNPVWGLHQQKGGSTIWPLFRE